MADQKTTFQKNSEKTLSERWNKTMHTEDFKKTKNEEQQYKQNQANCTTP